MNTTEGTEGSLYRDGGTRVFLTELQRWGSFHEVENKSMIFRDLASFKC